MSSVDNRVVELEFNNKEFEAGIKDTLKSLEALKEGLKLDGAAEGLKNIESASKDVKLDGMASALDNISSKFSVMGAVGFSVIQSLTNSALDFAKRIGSMVLDPLVAGGKRRALNIEQAKFQFRGLGMDIEETMASALAAVTGTAYGLDAAAKAAGQFGASGLKAGDQMTSALRAIAGVAAMTNSSFEDISDVFTKIAGNGRVMGDDLLRMSSRGLNAAATLAKSMGTSEEAVRKMVTAGKLSFEEFYQAMDKAFGANATKANETYTGSLANLRAAFSRIGATFFTPFLVQQRDLFNSLSPAIDKAAKSIKPLTELVTGFTGSATKGLVAFIDALNFDEMYRIVAPLLEIIKNVVSAISGVIAPIREAFGQIFPPASVDQIVAILNAIMVFTSTLKMGVESTENLKRTFAGLFAVLSIGWSIIKAVAVFLFDLFGMVTDGSGGFLNATANIGDFLVALDMAIKKGTGLTNFFKGFANVLSGPIKFIKELSKALLSIFDFDAPSADNLLKSFEPLGDLGALVLNVWERVIASFGRVISVFQPIANFMKETFGSVGDAIAGVVKDLDFDKVLDIINTSLGGGMFFMLQRIAQNLTNQVGSIAFNLTQPFRALTYSLSVMQTTLRAMTLMQIAIAIGLLAASVIGLSKVDAAGLTRALSAMTVMFGQLFAALKVFTVIGGMKGLIAVSTGLILFATAIRILVSSVKALAELSWEDLAKGLLGVTVLIGALTLAVKGMSGHTGGMISAGAGLLVLAIGIKILASAVTDLSVLSWEEMAKGLVGIGALLGALVLFTKFAEANKGGLAQGAGLILLATGIKILASAAEDFAQLSWEEIGKGLVSITAILGAFAIFSKVIDPAGLIRAGVSLVLIGAAMNILATAIHQFSSMSWEEIGKGLVTMAGALLAIALALNLMPPSTLASAAALVAVSFALGLIADALGKMGGMSWEEIGKGLVTLAGSLGIIALAMYAMSGALPGAAATFVVAAALKMLASVLETFGNMSWQEIARGLGTLAGVFVVLGLAALVLTPVVPVILALGAAVALLGVGLALAGAGVLLFATGLTALAAAGAAGAAAVVAIVAGLLGLLPLLAKQLAEFIIIFAKIIGTAGPEITKAITTLLLALISAIARVAPKIIDTFGDILVTMVEKLVEIIPEIAAAMYELVISMLAVLTENVPGLVAQIVALVIAILEALTDGVPGMAVAATALIVALIDGIADNVDTVIDAGANLIISLIKGISENMVKIVDAGMEAVINFINGVADAIRDRTPELQAAGKNLASAIVEGMTSGLRSMVSSVASAAGDLARSALQSAKGVLGIRSPSKEFEKIGEWVGEGFAEGLVGSKDTVLNTWDTMSELLNRAMENSARNVERLQERLASLNESREKDIRSVEKAEARLVELNKKRDKNAQAIIDTKNQLEDLKKAQDKDLEAIDETTAALAEAQLEYDSVSGAVREMTDTMGHQRHELELLGAKYDLFTRRLDRAKQALDEAIQTRDDYNRSISQQLSTLPDISEDTGLEQYINELKYANADLAKFSEVILELRKMGLSDALYEEFLSKGPDILPFLEELHAGGVESVETINELNKDLTKSAERLGERVSRQLYQAGVDAAHGLVEGLKSQRAAVEAEMTAIANSIREVLALQLQIKSPSRVMQKLGEFAIKGLAVGIKKSKPMITKAAAGAGEEAVDAMKKSISEMSTLLAMETDMNPRITPILDLSAFRKDAAQINSTLSEQMLAIDSSYSKAKYAAVAYRANVDASRVTATGDVTEAPRPVVFNQYNQSPKALSSAEIYRQTKNQLSVVKGALTPNATQDA